jgi:cation diffusion facilitator family transporter
MKRKGSARVVVVAFFSNLGVTIAFGIAAAITGSISMFAQTVHAAADTGNQAILFVAERQSTSHHDGARLEAGRAAYFWALLAAVGVFVVGGTLSVWEGIRGLLDPDDATDFAVAYVVLVVAMALDGVSWSQAFRQTRSDAAEREHEFFDQLIGSSDPTTRAVFGEDSAALIGDVLALTGIALHQVTGSPVPDAIGSILIGILLIVVAVVLGRRNLDFLVGQGASTHDVGRVRRFLESFAEITNVDDLVVTYVGPDQAWIVARVRVRQDLSAAAIEQFALDIENVIRAGAPEVIRVDLVPIAEEPDAGEAEGVTGPESQ